MAQHTFSTREPYFLSCLPGGSSCQTNSNSFLHAVPLTSEWRELFKRHGADAALTEKTSFFFLIRQLLFHMGVQMWGGLFLKKISLCLQTVDISVEPRRPLLHTLGNFLLKFLCQQDVMNHCRHSEPCRQVRINLDECGEWGNVTEHFLVLICFYNGFGTK